MKSSAIASKTNISGQAEFPVINVSLKPETEYDIGSHGLMALKNPSESWIG